MDIDSLHDRLQSLGVTPSILAGIGIISLILFIVSTRVVLKWYLGIDELHAEIRALRGQISSLRISQAVNKVPVAPSVEQRPIETPPPATRRSETFRLTH